MTDKVKVEAELKFDTNAQKMLGELKTGFDNLQKEVEESDDSLKDFVNTFAAMTAANLINPLLSGLKEMVTATFELGNEAYDTTQGIAGMMTAMSPRTWADARGSAELLYRDFTNISIAVGHSKDDIKAAHESLRTFLGGNDAAFQVADDNIANIAKMANVLGISAQEIGSQFGKMGAGFVSMESPMFNLLKGTGIFSSDITKVNAEWQKLTQQDRIARLEGAFANIAGNLQTAAPTMSDMLTSMKETGTAFLESFGGAVLREVIDNTEGLRQALIEGGDSFDDFAKSLGKDFGEGLADIIDSLTEAAIYLKENGAEIKQDIVDAFTFAKDVFDTIVDNAGLIGAAIGAGMLAKSSGASIVGAATKFAAGAMGKGVPGAVVEAGAEAASITGGGLAHTAGKAIPALISAIVAGGPPIWAAAAAVTALTAGFAYFVHEGQQADNEMRDRIDELIARERDRNDELGQLSEMEHDMQVRERNELIQLAEELGEKTAAIKRFEEAGADKRAIDEQYINPALAAAENLRMTDKGAARDDVYRTAEETAVSEMSNALKNAVQSGDTEVSKALLKIMLDNEKLKAAFMNSADVVGIGADAIKLSLKSLEEMGLEGGNLSKFFKSEAAREFPGVAPETKINFNGGQTFKIQQEFRDQDPDRIAVAFERRFTQAAVARVQASTSAPFGA